MRSSWCSVMLSLCLSAQLLLSNTAAADPLFQEVEIPAPTETEGVILRPLEGGDVTIGSTSPSTLLPNLRFLPGRFPPPQPPDTTIYEVDGITISYADTSPRPPREVPPLSPSPPILPTMTVAANEIVEFGSGVISTHIKNNGYAAVGSFNSVGDLSVQGDFVVEEGSYLYFDVGGTDPGEYDLIREYRQFAFSGSIRIIFRNGYAPQAGDIVPLVQFPESLNVSVSNLAPEKLQFANITSSPYVKIWIRDSIFGIKFYADTTFVPEPSTTFLMTCGMLFCGSRRRWR